ncbi:hypothetical protein F-LCD7_0250 [Faustovirus]|nr:hypothetical protein F-LCD7_0250 [Faustovirus]
MEEQCMSCNVGLTRALVESDCEYCDKCFGIMDRFFTTYFKPVEKSHNVTISLERYSYVVVESPTNDVAEILGAYARMLEVATITPGIFRGFEDHLVQVFDFRRHLTAGFIVENDYRLSFSINVISKYASIEDAFINPTMGTVGNCCSCNMVIQIMGTSRYTALCTHCMYVFNKFTKSAIRYLRKSYRNAMFNILQYDGNVAQIVFSARKSRNIIRLIDDFNSIVCSYKIYHNGGIYGIMPVSRPYKHTPLRYTYSNCFHMNVIIGIHKEPDTLAHRALIVATDHITTAAIATLPGELVDKMLLYEPIVAVQSLFKM